VISPTQRPLSDNKQQSQKTDRSMPPAGMEPPIPASEWPQTHALDRAAAGVGFSVSPKICRLQSGSEKYGGFMKHSVVTDCTRFSSPDRKLDWSCL
jgi:hypothetical protein